ncbi:MAG: hypothetical protein QXZ43_04460 [Candidatus Aenigmatarchaeota archaeon]
MGMVNTNRQRGKAHQRKIAKMFKGINMGSLSGVDVLTDKFAIECKSRIKFVGRKWYNQAVKNNKYNKIPVVIVHEKNKKYSEDLVILSITDFLKFVK